MGRRRGRGVPPPKPFDGAWTGIDTLEATVVQRMLDVHFTAEQVVRWMFPDDIVDKCQAAFPYVRGVDRGSHIQEKLMLPLVFPTVACTFILQAKEVRMLVPENGRSRVDENRSGPILPPIRQAFETHESFEKVRQVVRWLNAHATIGAARHYCPWLTSILPADHEFQKATGAIYREPSVSMAQIMPVMRECGAIMASALLCGECEDTKSVLNVQFHGTRDNEAYTSQQFGMI